MAKSLVAIAQNADVHESITGALDLLGDLSPLLTGRYVAIKPNDTWADESDLTACTQADTVEAVIRYIKRYRPSKLVVTGGAGAAETDAVFALLGINRVLEREGVGFFDHNRPPFTPVFLDYGPQEKVMVNPVVLEYETLISLAQHKVHYAAIVTLTMKNIAMSYPAADYYGHPRSTMQHPHSFFTDLHGFIVGMCQRFPISIGIIAGHPVMVGRGPIGGQTFESELVIASRDFVAADSIGADLLGARHVPHILEAARLGLGTASLDNIDIAGIPLDGARAIFHRQQVSSSPSPLPHGSSYR